jgi:hypothetical protein
MPITAEQDSRLANAGSDEEFDSVLQEAGLRLATVQDAYDMQYRPDPDCRERGAFVADGRSLTGTLLERLGILGPLPRRWNDDGSWNW